MSKKILLTGKPLIFNDFSTIVKEEKFKLIGIPVAFIDNSVYSVKVIEGAIESAKSRGDLFNSNRLLCSTYSTLDGRQDLYVKPMNTSHVVIDAYIREINEEKYLVNDWLILDTNSGKNLRLFIETGISMGTSIRGLGICNKEGKVSDYEYLGTDVVLN